MLEERRGRDLEEAESNATARKTQADEPIDFAHLNYRKGASQVWAVLLHPPQLVLPMSCVLSPAQAGKNGAVLAQIELEDKVFSDLQLATGATDEAADAALTRTLQLTGLSDAVYAEAVVITHQYDVVLDVTVLNRTDATMQSLCLELATMGDLKLVERPQNYTLAAGESKRLRANIKVRPVLAQASAPAACCAHGHSGSRLCAAGEQHRDGRHLWQHRVRDGRHSGQPRGRAQRHPHRHHGLHRAGAVC